MEDDDVDIMSPWTDTKKGAPPIRNMSWLPIIIIFVSVLALLIFGVIFLIIRRKSFSRGYGPTATNEQGTTQTTARA